MPANPNPTPVERTELQAALSAIIMGKAITDAAGEAAVRDVMVLIDARLDAVQRERDEARAKAFREAAEIAERQRRGSPPGPARQASRFIEDALRARAALAASDADGKGGADA